MVLEHDHKHPEMLNIPTDNIERYHALQTRQASQKLITKMKNWSDFELLEDSHYVKYIDRCVITYNNYNI